MEVYKTAIFNTRHAPMFRVELRICSKVSLNWPTFSLNYRKQYWHIFPWTAAKNEAKEVSRNIQRNFYHFNSQALIGKLMSQSLFVGLFGEKNYHRL